MEWGGSAAPPMEHGGDHAMPADLALIWQRIRETYGDSERFNGALLCIFQEAAF